MTEEKTEVETKGESVSKEENMSKKENVSKEPENNSTPPPEEEKTTGSTSQPEHSSSASAKPKVSVSESSIPKSPSSPVIRRQRLWPIWLVIILLLGCFVAAGYFFWQYQQQVGQRLETLATSDDQLLSRQSADIRSLQSELKRQLSNSQSDQQQQFIQGLESVQQRLDQHSRRILSLSTTSREDWLLAEAEYLIRLANQRLLMERQAVGALALLEGADQVLLEVDDLDLFSVRERLAKDITALQLTAPVDRSGIYLRLAAIAEQVLLLPTAPRMADAVDTGESVASGAENWYQRLWENMKASAQGISRYIRVTRHDRPVEPLLPPDGGLYLRQNLRFMIERAQLAMLREEPEIYSHSLEQAILTLQQYFSTQEQAVALIESLSELSQREIAPTLPNINGSLVALQEYIERLHQLSGSARAEEEVK